MIEAAEKTRFVEEHWVPSKTTESFAYAVARWCEDYESVRAGLLALQSRIEKNREEGDPAAPTYGTLRKYADGNVRNATLETAVPVLRAILG